MVLIFRYAIYDAINDWKWYWAGLLTLLFFSVVVVLCAYVVVPFLGPIISGQKASYYLSSAHRVGSSASSSGLLAPLGVACIMMYFFYKLAQCCKRTGSNQQEKKVEQKIEELISSLNREQTTSSN